MRDSPGAESQHTRSERSGDDDQSYYTHYSDGSMGLAKRDSKKLSLVSYVVVKKGSSSSHEGLNDESREDMDIQQPERKWRRPAKDQESPVSRSREKPSFDHSSSTHKARGDMKPASMSASTSGSSLRRRSRHPSLDVITDHDREDVEEEEDPLAPPSKKVAEDLSDPTNPRSPGQESLDANEFRSRRRERLSRLAQNHRSISPQKKIATEEPNDQRITRSLSPQKKTPGILHNKDRTLSPPKLHRNEKEPVAESKAYAERRLGDAYGVKSSKSGGASWQSPSEEEGPLPSPKVPMPEDHVTGWTVQDNESSTGSFMDTHSGKKDTSHASNSNGLSPQSPRAILEKKHAGIRAYMLRKTQNATATGEKDDDDDLSPRPHRSPAVVHYDRIQSLTNLGTLSPLRSQDSDDTSAFTSHFQEGIPCVTRVFQSTERMSTDAKGCVNGCVHKGTSFVSGVWQSCASGIGGYQTESKKSLLQLEMIAEQSISSIFHEESTDGRRSPDAFRHTRDLLAQKDEQEEQRDDDDDGHSFVRGVEGALSSLGTKIRFGDIYGGNGNNREKSMMEDMRNMFDSISKFAITPHHTYMGTDEFQAQHKHFASRYGNTEFEQQPYVQFERRPAPEPLPSAQKGLLRTPLFSSEESISEVGLHHFRKYNPVPTHSTFSANESKEPESQAVSGSTFSSVPRGTKDRRSMFMELQRRRKKHGMVKEEEEPGPCQPVAGIEGTPIKPDPANLRDVYLSLYDKIHGDTGKSLEQLQQSASVGEESEEEGHDYAVVWAASEEDSLSPQPWDAGHSGVRVQADTRNKDVVVDPVHVNNGNQALSKRSLYDHSLAGEASVSESSGDFLDANQEYHGSDEDRSVANDVRFSTGTSPVNEEDVFSDYGATLLPAATSRTHPDHVDELVHKFLHDVSRSQRAGLEEENHDDPKTDPRIHFREQPCDEKSVGSEEDRTIADSTMASGFSASSHTHELSMDDTIDTFGQSTSRSRSSRSSATSSCEIFDVPPEIPHPLGPISEYQVLYQISEEDEEVDTDSCSEGVQEAQGVEVEDDATEASIRFDRTWTLGKIIKSMLRWTIILVVANSFGFFHWLLDVPMNSSMPTLHPAGVVETHDPVPTRRASFYEIETNDDASAEEKEPSSMPLFLFPDGPVDSNIERYEDEGRGHEHVVQEMRSVIDYQDDGEL